MSAGGETASPAQSTSAWAPLAFRIYRLLWLAVLASNIGTWMQTVGAQWFLVSLPNAATLVALVQTADTLPDLILALPGGALADIFDRRRFLIVLQVLQIIAGVGLTWLTFAGQMTPPLLLGFTFLLGAGAALQTPAYEALIPDLVPRSELHAAVALGSVNVNLARAVGPAFAGVLIAKLGVGAVFALNTVTFVFLPVVLLLWRPPADAAAPSPEQFVAALRAGGRYVRYSPVTQRILLRLCLFVFPATVLWALLPLIASHRLGLGADGYGLLLAALGGGAVGGAFLIPWLTAKLAANRLLAAACVTYAGAMLLLVAIPNTAVAVLSLVLAGAAWLVVIAWSNAEIQLFLPAWVRARGLATYQMVLFGSQAVGALAWGLLAEHTGLVPAFLIAAAALLLGTATIVFWPSYDLSQLPTDVSAQWDEPSLVRVYDHDEGPIVVTTAYTVAQENEERFLKAMVAVRLSRLRTGAISWELYREGETGERFIELYTVTTWGEHLQQHGGRQTAVDAAIDRRAREFASSKPVTRHYFPAELVGEEWGWKAEGER
ncbi:MAG TPA: MFS transporter [Gemmatimonadales bacterium]|nr:MFS transporter [Gemmatimonadales bacterium]